MEILLSLLQFVGGLFCIIKGADMLTDGAANIAKRFGIPSLVVGLTIVAMGSSAPELVVSVVSAIQGNADIAVGNVVGSNLFNTLAIMGITSMVCPIMVERSNVRNDVPFTILASVALCCVALDVLLNGGEFVNSISRTDGILLLCIFVIFISYTLSIDKNDNATEGNDAETSDSPVWKNILFVLIGLAGLIFGGNWLVAGASEIALGIGISQSIVALTIVSAGTSAPELAASIMAARKGDTAMALGNVVGSNVFNVFFVLGTSAAIHPLGIGGISLFDLLYLLGASILLWIMCRFGKTFYTITRIEGALLTLLAVAYYVIRINH